MRKILFMVLCCVLTFCASAQNRGYNRILENNRGVASKIINSGDAFLHSEASADTLDVAVSFAVNMLSRQIISHVETESRTTVLSNADGANSNESTLYEQVTKTFTDVNLSGYQILVLDEPDKKSNEYKVFVYISQDKVDEIIAEIKEEKAKEERRRAENAASDALHYYEEANKALNDMRIGDALKYLYWSYALGQKYRSTINICGKEVPIDSQAEALIDGILNRTKVAVLSCEKEAINSFQNNYNAQLEVVYCDENGMNSKVTNLDFEYFDGSTSQRGRIRDGIGVSNLRYEMNDLVFKCVIKYDKSETPADVYEVVGGKSERVFPAATKVVKLPKTGAKAKKETKCESFEIASAGKLSGDHKIMSAAMESIENAIRNRNYNDVASMFTEDAYESFRKLIKYGDAVVIGEPEYKFIDFGGRTLCRSIPMEFRFRNNKQFVENVTFRFNESNIVESLAFTLTNVAEKDIMSNERWDMNSRLTLLTFLEDYQTAYALGRIDYIKKVFSENALIIVGNKVERKELSDGIIVKENVKYETFSKQKYVERLENQFKTKEFINLNFTDTDFEKATNGKEFYGIRVRQEYFSSNYGDVGYLFLLVDLRGVDPIIHVRAWQNDKLPVENLFGLSDVY